MNQINNKNSKKEKQEEETLILLDIAKAIEEVKQEGYGSVTIFVQDNHIFRWEILKSRTRNRQRTTPKPMA